VYEKTPDATVKTTLVLPKALHKKARMLAALMGSDLKTVVIQALKDYLKREAPFLDKAVAVWMKPQLPACPGRNTEADARTASRGE